MNVNTKWVVGVAAIVLVIAAVVVLFVLTQGTAVHQAPPDVMPY